MTLASIRQEAAEKYPKRPFVETSYVQEAYVQGRLDQAKADAQIAESKSDDEPDGYYGQACFEVAAAIREAVAE